MHRTTGVGVGRGDHQHPAKAAYTCTHIGKAERNGALQAEKGKIWR